MSAVLKSYSGYWSIPSSHGKTLDCPGTLMLYDDGLFLDIHHSEEIGHEINIKDTFEIIHGEDDNGQHITLENVVFKQMKGYVQSILHVRFALIGCHITSFDTSKFTTAVVHFPNLREWAFRNRISTSAPDHDTNIYSIDMSKSSGSLLLAPLDDMDLVLWSSVSTHFTQFDYNFVQDTYLNLISHSCSSINEYLKNTTIFSRFLSISLYKNQSPDSITLYGGVKGPKHELLFNPFPSNKTSFSSLISFNKFKERLPSILYQWYKNYDKVSPIAAYLSDSLSSSISFDSPDFLLIVQALDGYFKRFKNKQDGKDTRKNEDALNKLIKHFESVSAIKECKLDADVIVQTRDYYTHLLEASEKPKAITESSSLIWLTEKCKILLTCCILEYSGMSMQEINCCCEEPPIQSSLHWIKLHEVNK